MQKLNELQYSFLNLSFVKKVKMFFERFVNSELYFIILMAVALLNWKLRIIYLELIFGLIIVVLIFLLDINRMRFIPIGLFAIASLRLPNRIDYLIPTIISGSIIIPLSVIDLFRKKVDYNNQIFTGMILVLIAMIFSITNAPNLILPIMGILMWVFYTYLYLYIFNKREEQGTLKENRIYIAKSLTYLGILIFMEMMFFYLEYRDGAAPLAFFTGKSVNLGWAVSTYVSMVFLTIIPMTCYLFIQYQRKYHLLVIIVIEVIGLLLLLSRGAYLAIVICVIPFLIKFLSDIKNKTDFTKKILLIINICLLIMLFVAIPTGFVKSFYEVLNSRGLSLTGRELLYRVGLNVFSRYPLFGGGIYTSAYYLSLVSTSVYYHNFIIQTVASIGIIGLFAFIYYLYHVIKQATIKDDYNIYVFFIILNMIIHGLFDTTFYNPLVMVLFSLILPLMIHNSKLKC